MRHHYQVMYPDHQKVKIFIGDVRLYVKSAIYGVDYIFHTAANKCLTSSSQWKQ